MWNPIRQSIGMEEVRMENKYLQELTFIKLKPAIIQKPERW